MLTAKMLSAISTAWDLLIDKKLPEKLRRDDLAEDEDGELLALAFPIVGLISGVGLYIFGQLLYLIFGLTAGTAIFALTAFAVSEMKDSGRSFSLVVSFVNGCIENHGVGNAINGANENWRNLNGLYSTLTAFFYIAVKLTAFSFIFVYRCQWVIPVFVLAFAAQGYLSTLKPEPIVKIDDTARHHIWLPAVFILLFFIGHPAAPLISFAFAFGGAVFYGNYIRDIFGRLSPAAITLFGATTEIAVLTIGALSL